MDRQTSSLDGIRTRVSLFFKSPTSEHDEETTIGSYVCTIPNHLLENFMLQASQLGGKLESQTPDQLNYTFDGPGSVLAVDSLARTYMFSNH